MLVRQKPLVLPACKSTKLFGNTSAISRTPRHAKLSFRGAIVAAVKTKVPLKKYGGVSVQGTSRKRNEDRFDLQACGPLVLASVDVRRPGAMMRYDTRNMCFRSMRMQKADSPSFMQGSSTATVMSW